MITGMSTACFFPHTYTEQTIALMAQMNVRYVEVFFCCLSEYKKSFVAELKKRVDDAGISVCSRCLCSLSRSCSRRTRAPVRITWIYIGRC